MSVYYPMLERRPSYKKTNKGSYYSNYNEYYDEVSEDCKKRCVYCDIRLDEMGGEGMQLDHFRPQKHFSSLKSDPNNLVLACPKCNVLKRDHWPCDKSNNSTYQEEKGFIDPFLVDRNEFFSIDNEGGEVSAIQHPSSYMISLLQLNRHARILQRQKRALNYKVKDLSKRLVKELETSKDKSLEHKVREQALDRGLLIAKALEKIAAT